jgi:osmoprotectant transport system ATP-binding protein
VIQQVGLFPHQTVGENVSTVPRLLGWDAERQRARADELLDLVGLDPGRYAGRYPSVLSGGERQRVGVARALAADPPVLLMDEPFGAVDPIVRERLQNELLRLQERLAKTILFVTHDIDEAIKMGDLVAVMQIGGHLAQFGSPDQILASPANDFVARFVGADRGLKRLALVRVGEVELVPARTVRQGSDASAARLAASADELPYVLVVDERDHPVEWRQLDSLPSSGPIETGEGMPAAPVLDRHTTLKDALSMLLATDVQAGIVVDDAGAVRGLVTADMITERARTPARSSAAPAATRTAAAGVS